DVLQYVSEEISVQFMKDMDTERLLAVSEHFDNDDLADILQQLPETLVKEVLASMTAQNRARMESLMSYSEDSAGGLMNTDVTTVRTDITLEVVLRYLRMLGELPENTDSLYVVDHNDHYLGTLRLSQVVSRSRSLLVSEVMSHQVDPIPANMTDRDVARRFEKHDMIYAQVVDKDNRLLGRITNDDVVDVIRDEAEHSMLSMAGLGEDEDTFATVKKSVNRRSIWLAVNLITAFLASWVIGLFETTIQKQVALAVLMPIVASMGGIAGSQVLTLMIRGQALGHVERSNAGWLLNREMVVGALNGVLWALVVAVIAVLWFQDLTIGIIIACAIIINLLAAALAGTMLPILLKTWGIDPALAGSVLLTTITDVVGFFAFLGLATFFYS
uniref:magnesium transporter n=1 Tax=uncultured Amphritea sp. TaxID=981605 RepID=UPI00261561AB